MSFDHTYSDNIYHEKIAVLGIYPPPLGGVSVHIKHVIHKLKKQNNHVYFFSTEPRWRYKLFYFYLCYLFIWFLIKRPDRVFYHGIALKNSMHEIWLLVFLKRFLQFKLIFVEHNCRHLYKRKAYFIEKFKKMLFCIDHLVLSGNLTYLSYKEHNLLVCSNTIEGAFLPPDPSEEQVILRSYQATLFEFLTLHKPVILVNAFQLVLLDGRDLYGIDVCIAMLERLTVEFPQVGLIIALGAVGNKHYLHELEKKIKNAGLCKHIYFLQGQKEFWPLFKRIDLFVRPTLSDGASVSVQEALYFNVPVVASDVCDRPEGTHLFRIDNPEDFLKKIQQVLHAGKYRLKEVVENQKMFL